jgi:hypothetical protein
VTVLSADETGGALEELLGGTKSQAVIAAPFIKYGALKRLLDQIPNDVRCITCVVRWDPGDIAAKVSDIEIWDLIKTIPSAQLLMHPLLHAKYFRSDDNVLVGSANVTHKALGWSSPSNLELLTSVNRDSNGMADFETKMVGQSILVTDLVRDGVLKAAQTIVLPDATAIAEGIDNDSVRANWIPQNLHPDLIFPHYAGVPNLHTVDWDRISAEGDLHTIRPPSQLDQNDFNQLVKSVLLSLPITRDVLKRATNPITPLSGQEIIREFRSEENQILNELDHWTAYRKWLLYFISDRFREPYGSEDLILGQVL